MRLQHIFQPKILSYSADCMDARRVHRGDKVFGNSVQASIAGQKRNSQLRQQAALVTALSWMRVLNSLCEPERSLAISSIGKSSDLGITSRKDDDHCGDN